MRGARRTWSVRRSAARARQRSRWAFFSSLLGGRMESAKILVVDDDPDIVAVLDELL